MQSAPEPPFSPSGSFGSPDVHTLVNLTTVIVSGYCNSITLLYLFIFIPDQMEKRPTLHLLVRSAWINGIVLLRFQERNLSIGVDLLLVLTFGTIVYKIHDNFNLSPGR